MKKIISTLLTLAMIFTFTACGENKSVNHKYSNESTEEEALIIAEDLYSLMELFNYSNPEFNEETVESFVTQLIQYKGNDHIEKTYMEDLKNRIPEEIRTVKQSDNGEIIKTEYIKRLCKEMFSTEVSFDNDTIELGMGNPAMVDLIISSFHKIGENNYQLSAQIKYEDGSDSGQEIVLAYKKENGITKIESVHVE